MEYSDGETVESNPVVNLQREVHYFIDGLKYATEYTITVTVKNGVSDQDPENKHLRRCELRLKTQEGSKLKSLAAYKYIINISDEQGVIHNLNIIIMLYKLEHYHHSLLYGMYYSLTPIQDRQYLLMFNLVKELFCGECLLIPMVSS